MFLINKEHQKKKNLEKLSMRVVLNTYWKSVSKNSERTYKNHLKVFSRFLGLSNLANDIDADFSEDLLLATRKDALRFFNHQLNAEGQQDRDGVSSLLTANTINQRLEALRRIYSRLQEEGLIEENPFCKTLKAHKVAHQKRATNLVPYHFVEKMLEAPAQDLIGLRDRALLATMFGCGLRREEIIRLKLEQFDYTNRRFRNVITKGEHIRNPMLSEDAFKALERLIEARNARGVYPDTYIFKSYRNGAQSLKGHIDGKTAWRIFKKWAGVVGLDAKQYSPHSARATAITKLLDDGFTHRQVRNFSGHASVAMVERYDKMRGADSELDLAPELSYKKKL